MSLHGLSDSRSEKSELVTCVAKVAFGEREDLRGRDREYEGYPTTFVVDGKNGTGVGSPTFTTW